MDILVTQFHNVFACRIQYYQAYTKLKCVNLDWNKIHIYNNNTSRYVIDKNFMHMV